MTREIKTFSEYLHNVHTFNTITFLQTFNQYIHKLPNKTCSSKIIYNILKFSLINNYYNTSIFRNTFNEYFEYKITNTQIIDNFRRPLFI